MHHHSVDVLLEPTCVPFVYKVLLMCIVLLFPLEIMERITSESSLLTLEPMLRGAPSLFSSKLMPF